MAATIHDCSYMFEKGETHEITLPLEREHDFTGSEHLKSLKLHEQSYKMHIKSIPEKASQKMWKMTPA